MDHQVFYLINMRVFVTKSNESLSWRRSLITEVSQESNLSLVNLETLFRRSEFSFIKLGQWSKKWQVVLISKPQLQIGLSESRKPCLNLWFVSWRWLKPRLRPRLLREVLINFGILLLKVLRLSDFRIDLSRLFHSNVAEVKK